MDNFLLLKFDLNREDADIFRNHVDLYNHLGFEEDDPLEKMALLSELPEWEVSDINIEDKGTISYGVYFEDSKDGQEEMQKLEDFLKDKIENFKAEQNHIDNSNWEDEWKKTYTSFEIGKKILVKPSWEENHQTDKIVIEIDPKMAFGTGTHETTSMCMAYVEDEDFTGKKVLDIGSGTGILSILASKLGAEKVDACDIDQVAVDNALDNIKINKTPNVNVFYSNLFSHVEDKYDLIFANILAEIIVRMLDDVDNYLNENGRIILSGIIDKNIPMVSEKLDQIGYEVIDTVTKGEWALISARKKHV